MHQHESPAIYKTLAGAIGQEGDTRDACLELSISPRSRSCSRPPLPASASPSEIVPIMEDDDDTH